ncbi:MULTISPECIES: YrdB family protein [unclassified Micromonospora]|uniref:YrdB family protein n=1 Tax=unclassified Micromonospora TaxID=2617518 RepID=UPI002FEFAEFD
MKAGLLTIALLVELAMLAVAGWWGFTLDAGPAVRVLAGLGAPLLIALVWGVFCSPRARVRLAPAAKYAVQAACFLVAGVLLTLAGHPSLAVGLVVIWAVDRALLSHGGHPA